MSDTGTVTEKWLDVSRQSTGFVLTLDQCARIKADGYAGIVVQLWSGIARNDLAEQTLANAITAGLKTAGYIALNRTYGGWEHVMNGKVAAGAEWPYLNFVAIDCEVDGITVALVRDAVSQVIALAQRPVIYTAKWWWVGSFANITDFSNVPLWNAFYDGDPDFDFAANPYGGWTTAIEAGEQYQGSTTFSYGGTEFSADINAFRSDFIAQGPGTGAGLVALLKAWQDDMTDTILAAVDLRNNQIGGTNALGLFALRQVQKSSAWRNLLGTR